MSSCGKSVIANALVLRPTSLVLRQRPRPTSYVLRPTQNCQLSFCLVLYVLQDSSFWTATKKDEIDCSAISRLKTLQPSHYRPSPLVLLINGRHNHCLHTSRPPQSLPTHFSSPSVTANTFLVPLSHCQHTSRPPQSLPTHFSSHSVTANTFLVPLSHCQHTSRPPQSLPTHFSSHSVTAYPFLVPLPSRSLSS